MWDDVKERTGVKPYFDPEENPYTTFYPVGFVGLLAKEAGSELAIEYPLEPERFVRLRADDLDPNDLNALLLDNNCTVLSTPQGYKVTVPLEEHNKFGSPVLRVHDYKGATQTVLTPQAESITYLVTGSFHLNLEYGNNALQVRFP